MGFGRIIAKTLIYALNEQVWAVYQNHFLEFFKGRSRHLDAIVESISETKGKFGKLPSAEMLIACFAQADPEVSQFISELAAANVPFLTNPGDVGPYFAQWKHELFKKDLGLAIASFEEFRQNPATKPNAILPAVQRLAADLSLAEQRFLGDQAGASQLVNYETLPIIWQRYVAMLERNARRETSDYGLPFKMFSSVRLRPGDLVFIGAFTSQGKSAVLRYLAYHLLSNYGRNVVFITMETSFEITRSLFEVVHANNEEIFPGAPRISYRDYRDAILDEEQLEFMFTVALPDWTTNPNYGNLTIVQPGDTRFTLTDLARRLSVVEQHMPVHALVIDYVPLMHPVPKDQKFPPQIQDYNQLIRDLKRYCLTYRSREGALIPLLCLSAAQVSRKAYDEALKRDNAYDLTALSTYTEIERSADVVMTAMMTPAMRATSEIKLQVHKNRDGEVPRDPATFCIDLKGGMGLEDVNVRTASEVSEIIQFTTWPLPVP